VTRIEKKPTQPIPSNWRLTVYSLAAGLICCHLLVTIGQLAAAFREVYHGLNLPPNWHLNLVNATHLGWTLPVGILVAVFLIVKDRSSLRPRAVFIDVVALIVTFSFFLFWAWAAFSPVFYTSGEIISGPR